MVFRVNCPTRREAESESKGVVSNGNPGVGLGSRSWITKDQKPETVSDVGVVNTKTFYRISWYIIS